MKAKLPSNIFITGIGTGVGKTLVSAVLCEALEADYWKPVQCGNLENTDTQFVRSVVSNKHSHFHKEAFRFAEPASPHFAALKEDTLVEIENLSLPVTKNRLIVEGAGGLLVPLNHELVVFDLIQFFKLPVIVVVRNYLGSINHTLLTCQFLESQGVEIMGIVFSGQNFNDNQEIIQHFTQLPVLGNIDEAASIDKEFVLKQAQKISISLSLNYEV